MKINKIIQAIKSYFVGAYRELRKVTWPTRKQTINYSVLVVAMSIGVAMFFSILDYFFNMGFNLIIR
ncbi:MAG: preprotein translocase subunit SecE [bacterium]